MTAGRRIMLTVLAVLWLGAGAAAADVSYIQVDTGRLYSSGLFQKLYKSWQGDVPLIGDIEREAERFGLAPQSAPLTATLLIDWDNADASALRLKFGVPVEPLAVAAAAENSENFLLKNGTDGAIVCLNKKELGVRPYVLMFSGSDLAWAGEESAIEDWKLRCADGPGRLFPDKPEHNAAAACHLVFPKRREFAALFGGTSGVDGEVIFYEDAFAVSSVWHTEDPKSLRGVLEAFYTLGVTMFFSEDRGLADELLALPKIQSGKGVLRWNVKVDGGLAGRLVEVLKKKMADAAADDRLTGMEDEGW